MYSVNYYDCNAFLMIFVLLTQIYTLFESFTARFICLSPTITGKFAKKVSSTEESRPIPDYIYSKPYIF